MFNKPTMPSPTVVFDADVSSEIDVVRASSSHVLVEPTIDGKNAGPFILDTGASGLVITPRARRRSVFARSVKYTSPASRVAYPVGFNEG